MSELAPKIPGTAERFSDRFKKTLGKAAVRFTVIAAGAGTILGIGSTIESATGHEDRAAAFGGYHITGAEKAWCRVPSRWSLCNKASALSGLATDKAVEATKSAGWGEADGGTDAVRHCYWNALMTKEFGRTTAAGFANRHEYDDTQNAEQLNMDLHNNMRGRDWANAAEPLQRCVQGVENNELIRLVN